MSNEKNLHKVVVKYHRSANGTNAVTGAFGGVTSDGSHLSMNLFLDRVDVPDRQEYMVDLTTNQIKSEKQFPPQADTIREVVSSVVMTYDNAQLIKEWLSKKIEEMEAMRLKINARSK